MTPRSLLLHLAFIAIASGCLIAGWWQVHRAMAGNGLSYLYSIEWPALAVVAGIGWWQMFHDTPEDIAARKAHHARMREASAAVAARSLPRSALAITVESEESASGRALGTGAATASLRELRSGEAGDLAPVATGGTDLEPADGNPSAELLSDEFDDGDPMTEYNRYLALLSVRGKAKTWRNPRGV